MRVEWNLKEDLSTVCEPYYQIANVLAKRITVRQSDDTIQLIGEFGCETFVPEGLSIHNDYASDRVFDGLMPNYVKNIFDYVLFPEKRKPHLTVLEFSKLTEDGETVFSRSRSFQPCDDRNCYLARNSSYCFVYLSKYLKYLQDYHPEQIEEMRAKYEENPFPTYTKLPSLPFTLRAVDICKLKLSTNGLKLGRLLIDKGLVIPVVEETTDDEKRFLTTLTYPSYLFDIVQNGVIDYNSLEKTLSEHNIDESRRICSFRVFKDIDRRNEQFILEFCGNQENSNKSLIIPQLILISYALLQTNQYEDVYKDAENREKVTTEKIEKLFGNSPLFHQKNRFYGTMILKDLDNFTEKGFEVADYIRTRSNGQVSTQILCESLLTFSENFSDNIREGGYDSYFLNFIKPLENTFYVLTDITEFINIIQKKDKEDSIYNRARNLWRFFNFFKNIEDNYYILLVGTEDEINAFIDLDRSFSLLFSKERLIYPNYTVDELYDNIIKNGLDLPKEDFLAFWKKHKGSLPFCNDKLIRYVRNFYTVNHRLPDDFDMRNDADFATALNKLVGLKEIKEQMHRVYNFMDFFKQAKRHGIQFPATNLHMLFKGNPGTGKTTVARIVAKMLYDCGVCQENKLVEVHCPDLIAEYLGQTATKTKKVIEKALGGVLFIDEAYALTQSETHGANDYGMESLAVITKMMEDSRDKVIMIFAGYSNEMEQFINTNPGLKSRIGYVFDFNDYTVEELTGIFDKKMEETGFSVDSDARNKVITIIDNEIGQENFGNGRFIDKVVQEVIMEHAQHWDKTEETMKHITLQDIPNPHFFHKFVTEQGKRKIGFLH